MPVLDALQAKREPNASSLVFFYKPGKRGEVPGVGIVLDTAVNLAHAQLYEL